MLKGKNKLQLNRETIVAILEQWLNVDALHEDVARVAISTIKVAPTYGADELSLDIEFEPVKPEPEGGA
jgi:hypothetical protein